MAPTQPSFYTRIADEYLQLVGSGDLSPIVTLAKKHHVPHSNVTAWVRICRQKGLLPEAQSTALDDAPTLSEVRGTRYLLCGCAPYFRTCPPDPGDFMTCPRHGATQVRGKASTRRTT